MGSVDERTTINLRAERRNRRMTQAAIARVIGVPRQVWARAEKGLGVHPINAGKIADYFEVEVTDIWPVDDAEQPA